MLSFIKRIISRPKPRLRHLYHFAVDIEQRGADYYNILSAKAQNEALKGLCLQLAEEELEHKRLFHKWLAQWIPLPIDQESLDALEQRFETKRLFSDYALENKTTEYLIRQAIESELKSADFYLSFQKDFQNAWKRRNLHRLAEEELAHADRLSLFLMSSRD